VSSLLEDASNDTSGDGATTLTDVEALSLLDGERLVEGADHLDVVTRHDHLGVGILGTFGPVNGGSLIGGTDEDLGTVVSVETSVTTTLLLGQDVHGDEELLVGSDGTGLDNDHTTGDILTLDTTEQKTGVVTSARLVARLLEGLNVGNLGLEGDLVLADKLDFGILLQETTLDTTRNDGTTARDGENILNRHEERLLKISLGSGDPLVDGGHQVVDLSSTNLGPAALKSTQSRAHDDGGVVTLEAVAAEELTHLHLDELKHLLVLDGIDLVDEDDNLLDTDLTGEEQVLSGLGHLTVRGGDNDDGTVHGSSTSNHVLDVIGVTGAVDVSIVAVFGLVLDVSSGDGDTTLALLGGLVNRGVVEEVGETLLGLALGDGGGEGGLAVIDVTNGTWGMSVGVEEQRERRRRTNVDVRLVALESSGVVSHVGTSARTPCGLDGVGGAIATESNAAGTQEGTGKRRHDACCSTSGLDRTTERVRRIVLSHLDSRRELNFFCLLCLHQNLCLALSCLPRIAGRQSQSSPTSPIQPRAPSVSHSGLPVAFPLFVGP
jgi:hypothetical protein